MANIIAVEPNLTGVRKMLQEKGYTVVNTAAGQDVMAVVVSGADNNLMNVQDATTKAPVIDASGKTPEQILSRIQKLR